MVDAEVREPAVADAEQVATRRTRITIPPFLRAHAALIGLGLLALAMIVAQSLWVSMDKQPPSWDPAHYLDLTLGHERAWQSRGLSGFFSDVITSDPVRAPLLTMLTTPIFLLVGPGPDRGTILNLLLWPVLLIAVYLLGRRLFSAKTGLLAAFLTATTPIIFGLAHEFLIEFLLTTLTTLTILLLFKTEGFTRRVPCVGLGIVLGLGMLTKITFPLYVAVPGSILAITALVPLFQARGQRESITKSLARIVWNLGIVSVLAVAIPFFWYWHDLKQSLEYAKWASNGAGSLPYGPAQPYKPDEIAKFTLTIINIDISWLYVVVPLVGSGLVLFAWGRRQVDATIWRTAAVRVAVLVSWLAIPFWYVALSHNHDPRFLAPAIPGFTVLIAAMLARVPQPRARRVLVVGAVALGTVQWFAALFTVPMLPDMVQVASPVGEAIVWWQGPQSRAHNHQPYGSWKVDEILTYLAIQNPSPNGVKPLTLGLLEAHPAYNPNTLSYYAHARQLPFSFLDVPFDPQNPTTIPPQLSRCDYLLVVERNGPSTAAPDQANILATITKTMAISASDPATAQGRFQFSATFAIPDGQAVLYAKGKPSSSVTTITHPVSVVFDGAIEFLGYDLFPVGKTTEGEVYSVTYYWRALRPLSSDYRVFVHVRSETGDRVVAGNDHPAPDKAGDPPTPKKNEAADKAVGPTIGWVPGTIVRDEQQLFIPNTLAPGSYPIRIGLYVPDVRLLAVTDGPPGASDTNMMGAFIGLLSIRG